MTPTWRIRELEWVEQEWSRRWVAEPIRGVFYEVQAKTVGFMWYTAYQDRLEFAATLDEAKLAASAHWRARLLPALEAVTEG